MIYKLIEGKEHYIKNCGKVTEISVDDLSCLKEPSKLFEKIILSDKLFELIKFPEETVLLIVDVVINNKNIDYLKGKLTSYNIPLYSLIINLINNYKRKYKEFVSSQETNEIIVACTKDNLIKVLDLSKNINKKIIIDGQSISLSDYKKMLDNYDTNSLNNVNIKYQEQNSPISIKDLYKLSLLIDNIVQNINKYNLSPLEKIIYTYDIVKYREYKESDCNKKNSRDLDKVLQGDTIVCVGYSNLFNAILKSIGVNAISLISSEKRHQRSMVYIKDNKYNIEGIYAFDPTFDSKKNNNYIDNYNYFALTVEKSEKDNPSTHELKPWTTFDELLNIYEQEDEQNFKDGLNRLNELEDLFEFVHEDGTTNIISVLEGCSYMGYEAKENAIKSYVRVMKKYNPKEISASVFMNALLRTRIIEYYAGIIKDFNIQDIIETSKERTLFQKEHYEEYKDPILKLLDIIDYNIDIYNRLESEISSVKSNIESDKLKVRLLKVLRNGRK